MIVILIILLAIKRIKKEEQEMEARQIANQILTLIEMSEEKEMDIQFDDMEYEFDALFRYLSKEMVEKIQRIIYSNKGALECSYEELKHLFKTL